jgi:hypothetical protein
MDQQVLQLIIVVGASAVLCIGAKAQWDPWPWKNVPRTPDGKVQMDAPPRKTLDGHIDLFGFWLPVDIPRKLRDLSADLKPSDVPLLPGPRAVYNERIENNGKDHPSGRCLPSGIPEAESVPEGLKIIQLPDVTLFLYEGSTIYRQIFTDGRPFPADPERTWMGYSLGHWEGNTFVVETKFQNGKTWLDMKGLPASDALRVVERFDRPNIGRINIGVTIDDPKTYTHPWSVQLAWRLVPDTDLIEYVCEDNRDLPHLVGK